jgi:hypothetical protein
MHPQHHLAVENDLEPFRIVHVEREIDPVPSASQSLIIKFHLRSLKFSLTLARNICICSSNVVDGRLATPSPYCNSRLYKIVTFDVLTNMKAGHGPVRMMSHQ